MRHVRTYRGVGAALGPGVGLPHTVVLQEVLLSTRGPHDTLHLILHVPGGTLVAPERPRVADLGVEQGDEGGRAEGAGGVEVGIVGRPAGHDLLIIHQRVTTPTQRTTRQKHLRIHTAPPSDLTRDSHAASAYKHSNHLIINFYSIVYKQIYNKINNSINYS